jgi:hypothetical protein
MKEPTETPTKLIGLKVFGMHYDIVWAPAQLIPDRFGHSDEENQEIVLRNNLRGVQCLDTLLHELIHAVSNASGVEISELQTHVTAMGLSSIIAQNPELLEWISLRCQEEADKDYQQRTRKIKEVNK